MKRHKIWYIPIGISIVALIGTTIWFLIDKSIEVGRLWFIPAILASVFFIIYKVHKDLFDGISTEQRKVERLLTLSLISCVVMFTLMFLHFGFYPTSKLGLIANIFFVIAILLQRTYSKKKKELKNTSSLPIHT